MSGNRDVTVVIPCFNAGPLVTEAVESALGQEGGEPQVVVVDDGSTEGETLAALERLPDGATVFRQPNAGLSAARNAGAGRSDTPLLLMLDADDMLHPTAIRRLRPLLDGERVGFAYGQAEFFGDWSGVMRLPDWDPYKLLYRSLVDATCLMRRDLFDDVGGFDPGMPAYEDWDFFLGAAERGWSGRRIPEVVYYYRRRRGTMVDSARGDYRNLYRRIRRKHAPLFSRAGELAKQTDLGPLGRAVYRVWFAWRPVPARVEQAIYGRLLFR